jgi:serine/threonine protein kinase
MFGPGGSSPRAEKSKNKAAQMIGQKLGHYAVTGSLGKGSMGEVWRARDTKLGREVAIKTLPRELGCRPRAACT